MKTPNLTRLLLANPNHNCHTGAIVSSSFFPNSDYAFGVITDSNISPDRSVANRWVQFLGSSLLNIKRYTVWEDVWVDDFLYPGLEYINFGSLDPYAPARFPLEIVVEIVKLDYSFWTFISSNTFRLTRPFCDMPSCIHVRHNSQKI